MDEPGFAGAVLTLTVTLTSALDCDRALWSNTEERREKVNGINGPYDRYRRIWSRVRRTSAPPGVRLSSLLGELCNARCASSLLVGDGASLKR